jgi:hypothetical protein
MSKNDGKGDSIYGAVPRPAIIDSVIKEAMADLNESESNKVNGPTKSKDSDYPEEG